MGEKTTRVRRTFTLQFKRDAVNLVVQEGKSATEIARHGMICSMSRPGRCQDNAVAESFFHTLKAEWIYYFDFTTREQARLAIFDYVEGFYNPARMHSRLNYRSPDEYEKMSSAA